MRLHLITSTTISLLALASTTRLIGTARAVDYGPPPGMGGGGASTNIAFRRLDLASDQNGVGKVTDPKLINSWGLVISGSKLVVANAGSGAAGTYSSAGRPLSTIEIPAPGGGDADSTDVALNVSPKSFGMQGPRNRKVGATYLLVTENGTIAAWNRSIDPTRAVTMVDNSGAGSVYKSVTVARTSDGPMLFAADFGKGVVEIYDGNFNPVNSFTDADLANANYVPFGLRVLNGHLFVTFALKSSPSDDDETAGPGLGYVDEFDLSGNFVRRVASQGTLNAPWGLALAPRNLGPFSGALLVGNFGDGTINAFDPATGGFLGQLGDEQGNVISIEGLWGLAFSGGGKGRNLYYAAGPGDEAHGVIGVLLPVKKR